MRKLFRYCLLLIGCAVLVSVVYGAVAYVYSRHVAQYDYRLDAWPPRAQYQPAVPVEPARTGQVRILAVEGGALFGLADLEVLKAMEEKAGKPIYELFDFFAGSSTGAIITTLLLFPDPETGKPMSAHEAAEAYERLGSQMLSGPLHHKVLTGFGLFGPALTNEKRIKTARQIVGEAQFKDLLRPAMYPAYSQKTGGLKVFRNWDDVEANIYLWPLVTAVTSVPSVFPAVMLRGNDDEDYLYGDPALISNEPTDLAYLHARTHLPEVDRFVIVSLGTRRDFSITPDIGIRGGMLEWFTPAFQLLYRGESNVSQGALKRHADFDSDVSVSLTVLSPELPADISSFDTSSANIDIIVQAGLDFVRAQEAEIDALVKKLTAGETVPDQPN